MNFQLRDYHKKLLTKYFNMEHLEQNFAEKELNAYQRHKRELEEQLSLGEIDFEDYIFQLSLLNIDRKNLERRTKK